MKSFAFDGYKYTQEEFRVWYGDDGVDLIWQEAFERTYLSIAFLHAWFSYIGFTSDDAVLHILLACLRVREEAYNQDYDIVLLRFIMRALGLRQECLRRVSARDKYMNFWNEQGKRLMDDIVKQWTRTYLCPPGSSNAHVRQVQRIMWRQHMGHKQFAMLVAGFGVEDWQTLLFYFQHELPRA
eukprot:Skav225657  [mRNA]  locus=scaffold3537:19838:20386:+ [translate_table: standard]